jgi:putative Mn2+ efflux pump MntP
LSSVGELKTALMIGGLTFIISAVVNAIGYYVCHCVGKYPIDITSILT